MIKTEERVIDEKNVSVTQLPARRAITLKAKLFRILGPALGSLITGQGSIMEQDIDIGSAIEKLFSKLDENNFVPIILEILVSTRVDGQEISKPEIFDITFVDDYLFMYKVIWFTLEVNYKSFLGPKGIGLLKEKFQTTIQSGPQKDSTKK